MVGLVVLTGPHQLKLVAIIVLTHVIHAGTNASVSQMAKDVCTFLRWTSGNDRHLLAALLRLLLPLSPFRALP